MSGGASGQGASSGPRLGGLDTLRGAAIVWMVTFHFCFDLSWFGVLHANFYADPFWTRQRVCIVSLFLLSSGLAQALGDARGRAEAAFWKRWGQIAVAGLAVVAGSYAAFPDSFIYFGILQGVAAMLLLHHLLLRRLGPWVLLLAPLAIAAPQLWGSAAFDGRLLNWTGLIAHKPVTEDYVPLLPWIGVFAVGSGLGALLARIGFGPLRQLPEWRPLAWLGRRPLTIYLVHQPLLVGGLWAVSQLLRR